MKKSDDERINALHEKVMRHLESLAPEEWSPSMWRQWKDIWIKQQKKPPIPYEMTTTSSVELKKLLTGEEPT